MKKCNFKSDYVRDNGVIRKDECKLINVDNYDYTHDGKNSKCSGEKNCILFQIYNQVKK